MAREFDVADDTPPKGRAAGRLSKHSTHVRVLALRDGARSSAEVLVAGGYFAISTLGPELFSALGFITIGAPSTDSEGTVMMYVIRTGCLIEELPCGEGAQLRGHDLVCFDAGGTEIKRYDRDTVMVFGHDERLKEFAL